LDTSSAIRSQETSLKKQIVTEKIQGPDIPLESDLCETSVLTYSSRYSIRFCEGILDGPALRAAGPFSYIVTARTALPRLPGIISSMRASRELLHSRTRLRRRYVLFPPEGYPPSKLPAWPGVEARVLAAPAMGAYFAEYLLTVPDGRGTRAASDGRIETFFYVLGGEFRFQIGADTEHRLERGGFAFIPPTADYSITADADGNLLMLRKAYEPVSGIPAPRAIVGHQSSVPGEPFMRDEGARLQMLLPDEMAYDLAMNIFSFETGHSLPVVETHVMEHGLYFLEGNGLYYLDDEWMEVQAGDFIWMGPYVPQSFYATGPGTAKYIYYKNVNRDVEL
jgi:(S)-ureidoglycine aminohydrolase